MLSTRDPPQNNGHIQTESEGLVKIFHANRDQKKAGVAIFILEKIDFKIKAVKRDKEGHYMMINRSIQEEDIKIVNMYAPNVGAPQYVRQMLTSMKGEINNNTLIVGDFGKGNGTPLQYSCLENPMDGGAWWAADHGVMKSRT